MRKQRPASPGDDAAASTQAAAIVAEDEFLQAARDRIEHGLFAEHFPNWRLSIVGTTGIAWVIAAMDVLVEPSARRLYVWASAVTVVVALIGAVCLYYERTRPEPESPRQRQLLAAWTALTGMGGAILGSLPWFLPAARLDLQLGAAAFIAIFTIAFAVSRGYRPLIYAWVAAQALALSLALGLHTQQPVAIGVGLLFSAFALRFGLVHNRAARVAIGQRLYAQHLHAELKRSLGRQLVERQREATLSERQRMLAELQDGFGSQLVSAQRLLESGRIDVQGAAALLRDCVVDLRLLLESQESAARDLSTLFGMLRYRVQRRIEAAGIRLHWRVADLSDAGALSGAQSLDLLRLLQEAIGNVLQHAGAGEIGVTTRRQPRELVISVEDDGCGFDPVSAMHKGHGIAAMQRRAARLGAELLIEPREDGGTAVHLRLRLPLGSAQPRAPAPGAVPAAAPGTPPGA